MCVGRGYDSWSSIHDAASRYEDWESDPNKEGVVVLYFGDHDPSGLDMDRSLEERLGQLGWAPEILRAAITLDDVTRYKLPPNPTKSSDRRTRTYRAQHGNRSWELDALPVAVLRKRIVQMVEVHMDLDALAKIQEQEEAERGKIVEALGGLES